MIDFHSHLDLYPKPREHARDLAADVDFVLSVTNTPSAWRGTKTLELENSRIHTAVGLHPQLATERKGELGLFEEIVATERFVGEVGLDGQVADSNDRANQSLVFKAVLRASAVAGGRILTVHSRKAATPVLDEIESNPDAGPAVLHWFSGNHSELRRAVGLGCWFSVGPAMMSGARGRGLASSMPRDRILTETDGPFVTIDRRAAEPHDVGSVLTELADIWSTTSDTAGDQINANLDRLLALCPVLGA